MSTGKLYIIGLIQIMFIVFTLTAHAQGSFESGIDNYTKAVIACGGMHQNVIQIGPLTWRCKSLVNPSLTAMTEAIGPVLADLSLDPYSKAVKACGGVHKNVVQIGPVTWSCRVPVASVAADIVPGRADVRVFKASVEPKYGLIQESADHSGSSGNASTAL